MENIEASNAGTVGIYMMGNEYLGHLSNIDMKNVQINAAKEAGIDTMGPIDNVNGDITISDTPVICRQASKWAPATLNQSNDAQWQINNNTVKDFDDCK